MVPSRIPMLIRVGIGHDTHRLGANRPLKIGGVEIPHTIGLVGHSDADVLLHALVDALLGAAAMGDIGEWFPDNDPANKDRDSVDMLMRAVAGVQSKGWGVVNVDAIVFAERPKLSAYKSLIAERISGLLGIAPNCVNIKAKTGELVGPVGRQEAISAEVVVLLEMQS